MIYGYIYKITNLINGKIYVGKHKYPFNKMDNSYWGSGLHLKRALDTYGKENFNREVLEYCSTLELLNEKESDWIDKLDSRNPEIGYNIKPGGDGGWEGLDFNGENNGMYGVHRFGRDNPNYGNHWSESSRKQMSETIASKGGHFGKKNPMYGKKHSEETIKKIKSSKLDENGNYKYRGEKSVNYGKHETHPCYGLHWWTNGVDKPIKSKECPGEGYRLGRK